MIETKKDKLFNVLRFVYVLLVIVIMYLPILIIMFLSVNSSQTGNSFTGFTLKWYQEIFTNSSLYTSILNSFSVALCTTIISSVLGTFFAIGLNAFNKKLKAKLMLLNNVPILNAEIVTGISIMIICSFLLPVFPKIFGFTTMLIAHVFFTFPYVVLSVLPKLSEIDNNLYEAAVDLGCPPLKSLWKVVIPSIETGILSGAMLAFTMSIDDFVISYFTTGNGFTNFSNWIYVRLGRRNFTPAAFAYNSLLTIVMLLILLLPQLKRVNAKSKKRG